MNAVSAAGIADAGARAPVLKAELRFAAAEHAWPVAIIGVPFDGVTVHEAIRRIEAMLISRTPHYVVAADADRLVRAQRDPELRRRLLEADLVIAEGKPLRWASRWLGNTLPECAPAGELVRALVRGAATNNRRFLRLDGAALESGHAEIVRRVRAANPDLLVVSFSEPPREKWSAAHFRALGVPVVIDLGSPSPLTLRHSCLNFLRLVPPLLAQRLRTAIGRATPARPKELSFNLPDWCNVDAGARLTRRSLEADATFWQALPERAVHCLVDLSNVRRVDGTGLGFLIRWRKQLLAEGRQLVLLTPSRVVRRTLAALRLTDHFVIANDLAHAAQHAALVGHTPATARRDGVTRALAWCGEIIAANADDVWRMTTDHIGAFAGSGATLIIIELARLRFVDSSGAALMLRLKKWSQELHVEIIFAHPPLHIRNVLQLTCIDQLLLEGGQ